MAIIDYKEKYEKAVQAAMLAKQDTESAVTIGILEEIFPELRESEDEKIRKEMITYFSTVEDKELIPYESWIAYLEKQGEQKPAWSEEDNQIALSIEQVMNCASLLNIVPEKMDKIRTWLKSLKERYTWKPSDEQMDALHDAAVYVDKSMFPYPKGILMKLYKQLKKLRKE